MKYIKTFESFSGLQGGNAKEVEAKINSMSPEEMAKLEKEVMDLSKTLGLSMEEMKDTEKVSKAMVDKGIAKDIEKNAPPVQEGLKEWWSGVKDKFYKFLFKFGIGGFILNLSTLAIVGGSAEQQHLQSLADYSGGTVGMNTIMIVSAIGTAVSAAAAIIGAKKTGKLD